MKNLSPAISLVSALALTLASCATYTVRTESQAIAPALDASLKQKTVAVEPTTVSFGASRLTIDLRDAHISVNGQEIQLERRYLAKDKDLSLGDVGVLDVNILKKSRVDPLAVGTYCQGFLVSSLKGEADYNFGFFKGLGEKNMGTVSSRPYSIDRSVYPPKGVYAEATAPRALFSKVDPISAGGAAGYDYVLKSDISLSSEVLEILAPPASSLPIDGNHVPRQGDYYLSLLGSLRFSLVDVATGQTVATEKSPNEWSSGNLLVRYVYLPVANGDAASYATYFRGVDFLPQAEDAARKALEQTLPLLAPFYVNRYFTEKAEKAK